MKKVLITGIAGGQGRLVARKLLARREHYRVHGVDRVAVEGSPARVALSIADVRQHKFEDVIRRERPDAIVHLAADAALQHAPAERHEVNVNGTKRLFEFAVAHGVENVVIRSSSYVYGALPENPYYMDERFPLSVSRTYPEAAIWPRWTWWRATTSGSFLKWRSPSCVRSTCWDTTCTAPSAAICGATTYPPSRLRPMMQFIHEDHLAEAIVLAIEATPAGFSTSSAPARSRCTSPSRTSVAAPCPYPTSF